MNRREFLALAGYASAATALPFSSIIRADDFVPYNGELLITVQAVGGWDVSSFCDPKINTDSTLINNWATGLTSNDIPKAGNIPYAPFANNAAFFEKFKDHMLVINGVDMQTNSHSTGKKHTWSGRTASGYPSIAAWFAYNKAPTLPVSYLNFGGFTETADLIRYSRIDKVDTLLEVLQPNVSTSGRGGNYYRQSDVERLVASQQARLARLQEETGLLPRQKTAMKSNYEARPNTQALEQFAAVMPADDEIESSSLLQQAQVAILGFKAGVSCAADLAVGGFDTHGDHDITHEPALTDITTLIDYLFDYAEQQGVAERLTVIVGSDFARTPYYNAGAGKDHWPVSSTLIMRKNAPWGNRVIGGSDEEQNSLTINPSTLQIDDTGEGNIIYPMHVHAALRTELGLPLDDFPLNNLEFLDLFNESLI